MSYRTIAEWAWNPPLLCAGGSGITGRVPRVPTICRVLQRLDGEQFGLLIYRWLARRAGPSPALLVIAIDDKTSRGARSGDDRTVHLVVNSNTSNGTVLGQSVVNGGTNEISAFAPLLDRIDVTGALITWMCGTHRTRARHLPVGPWGALPAKGERQLALLTASVHRAALTRGSGR